MLLLLLVVVVVLLLITGISLDRITRPTGIHSIVVTVKLCTPVPPGSKINKLIPPALIADHDPEGHCWALHLHSQQHELPSCMHPPGLLLEL